MGNSSSLTCPTAGAGRSSEQPGQFERVFARLSGVPITRNRARQEVTLWQRWQGHVGWWDAQPQGLAARTLDVQHTYDPEGKVLYLGTGERRSAENASLAITTAAGRYGAGDIGDGGTVILA